jgi:exoribonuclease R
MICLSSSSVLFRAYRKYFGLIIYVFDEKNHSLVGKNSGHKYIAGQGVEVMIAGVNMDKLFIDLELVGVE